MQFAGFCTNCFLLEQTVNIEIKRLNFFGMCVGEVEEHFSFDVTAQHEY